MSEFFDEIKAGLEEAIELEEFEKVLEYIKKRNEYTEDIYNQIQFLEKISRQINIMYEKYGEGFSCKNEEKRDDLLKEINKFTDSLTEDLGMIICNMFRRRNRWRREKEEEEDIRDADAAMDRISKGGDTISHEEMKE